MIVNVNIELLPDDYMLEIKNTLSDEYPEYFEKMSYSELEDYINENIDNNYTTAILEVDIELPEIED